MNPGVIIFLIIGIILGMYLLIYFILQLINNFHKKKAELINSNISVENIKLEIEKTILAQKKYKFDEEVKLKLEIEKTILAQKQLDLDAKALLDNYKTVVKESLDTLLKEKSMGFPWLVTAISDYWENYDKIFASYLEHKKRPAIVEAGRIKKIAEEKRLFKKEFLTAKYIIGYYEALFPWLREYVGFNSEELIKSIYNDTPSEEEDPVTFYMATKGEFESLSVSKRNQKALDRYWNRDKDQWQIGRDYERYIGYLYEKKGFKVNYHGIEKIREDLGRDLICINEHKIEVVQCKNWSSIKGIPIRENHITQLYGTTIKYYLEQIRKSQNIQIDLFPELLKKSNITPVMVTSGDLSDTAKEFANVLGIRVDKISMDKKYPCIKCNINFQTGEKIYHLPFDQQYDKVVIDISKGERWASTVIEAESYNFRRAWMWRPNPNVN